MRMLVAIAALAALTACNPFRRAKLPPPATPIPARIPDQISSEPVPPPSRLPAPPEIATEPVRADQAAVMVPEPPKGRPPRPVRRRVARPAKPAPAVTAEPEEEEAPPPQPVWVLGEALPPARRAEMARETVALNTVSERILAAAGTRNLTPAQEEMAARIRAFVKQSREAMEKNPTEALALAKRANTFARSLE